jgi:hypothetical protein
MKKIKLKRRLPNKLSALARLALVDLVSLRGTKSKSGLTYAIDMGQWVTAIGGYSQTCYICYGGSVLVGSGYQPKENQRLEWKHFSPSIKSKMIALDNLRIGRVESALSELRPGMSFNERVAAGKLNRPIIPYKESPERFIDGMSRLIIDLEVAGL